MISILVDVPGRVFYNACHVQRTNSKLVEIFDLYKFVWQLDQGGLCTGRPANGINCAWWKLRLSEAAIHQSQQQRGCTALHHRTGATSRRKYRTPSFARTDAALAARPVQQRNTGPVSRNVVNA